MPRLQRILIANRGEIAVRIIHACHDTGRTAIAAYADPDADALFVHLADEAYALHGVDAKSTYLNIDTIIETAKKAHADAIHPGYGFLAENADFAEAVAAAGMAWIGPGADTIRMLGSKVEARRIAAEVGAPMAPGTTEPVRDPSEVVAFAERHGLPLAIKAVYGGGGRGLKVVHRLEDVREAFMSATHEAELAFGNGDCFIERFLARSRHVEVQVLGDRTGSVVAVGTRDCSLQRRNQKLIEEAPAPFLPDEITRRLESAAVAICKKACYESAGTVEFLVDPDGTMSFMEVNTRIQVEHPVTEAVTGVDLVAAQLAIAEGARIREIPGLEDGCTPAVHWLRLRLPAFRRLFRLTGRCLSSPLLLRKMATSACTPVGLRRSSCHRLMLRRCREEPAVDGPRRRIPLKAGLRLMGGAYVSACLQGLPRSPPWLQVCPILVNRTCRVRFLPRECPILVNRTTMAEVRLLNPRSLAPWSVGWLMMARRYAREIRSWCLRP